jgi:hypothetical protein
MYSGASSVRLVAVLAFYKMTRLVAEELAGCSGRFPQLFESAFSPRNVMKIGVGTE